MTEGSVQPPESLRATDAVGAAAVDAIVVRRRTDLARLSLAARTASRRCESAEAALAAQPAAGPGSAPAELLVVVDAMLGRAAEAARDALDQARRDADAAVAEVMAECTSLLRREGVDPTVLDRIPRPSAAVVELSSPPAAADLWRSVPRVMPAPSPGSITGASPGLVDATPAGEEVVDLTEPMASVEVEGAAAVAVTDRVPAGSTTLLLDPPTSDAADAASAEVYDMFWQEVPGERRVRDRLLRRSAKEGA